PVYPPSIHIHFFLDSILLSSLYFSPSHTLSYSIFFFFFFNDTATTEIYTLSLHDALPIFLHVSEPEKRGIKCPHCGSEKVEQKRSEEHTSELQSLAYLVCRLLLEKKKKKKKKKKNNKKKIKKKNKKLNNEQRLKIQKHLII